MTPVVTDNPAANRYEAHIGAELAGVCDYSVVGDSLLFRHTEVYAAFEGRGIGGALARFALDDARARGLHVIPVCPFIAEYLRKHPADQDLVREDVRKAFRIEAGS